MGYKLNIHYRFVLSVLICFTITLFYMADIYARSEE